LHAENELALLLLQDLWFLHILFLQYLQFFLKQESEKNLAVFTGVAKEMKGEALFVSIDADVPEHKEQTIQKLYFHQLNTLT
jgi:hypothetical protein